MQTTTIKLKHGSPEWLAYRKSGIGGSDASAILGLNPYKSNIELWEEKTGRREPKPISNNAAVEYGKAAEKYLTELFKLDYPEYSVKVPKSVVYRRGCMFASLDGELRRNKDGEIGILEIKTAELYASMHREKWDNKIPNNYYIQILHYLATTGYKYAILKAQLKSANEDGSVYLRTKHYYIDTNDSQVKADIKYLIAAELDFWGYVERNEQPPTRLPQI